MKTSNFQLPTPPKNAIIGCGALGTYYGTKLAQHGNNVHFLLRSDYEHVKTHGIHITSKQGNFHLQQVNAHNKPEDIGPVDRIFIGLKTTANHALPDLIAPLLKKDTQLITLQNGLGSDELLAQHFGPQRVLGGLCFVCLNRTAPGEILHIGEGHIGLGEFTGSPQERTHEIATEFQRCGVACSVVDNLARERWKKLVWNIPFNGLSIAAGGIDCAQILADESLTQRVKALMHEVITAAKKLGHEIPLSLIDKMITSTKGMGPYQPSSLLDYKKGLPLEIESIWGEPLRRATQADATTPHLKTLYHFLKQNNTMNLNK